MEVPVVLHRVTDKWGNAIELTDERWDHITTWHPDLAAHLDAVLDTIKLGRRRQDAVEPAKYRYHYSTEALLPDYNAIVVIVKLMSNNFVITSYPVFVHSRSSKRN